MTLTDLACIILGVLIIIDCYVYYVDHFKNGGGKNAGSGTS